MGKPQSTGNLVNALAQDSSNNIGIGGAANASFKLQVTGATNLTGALSGTSAALSSTATATAFIPSGSSVPTNGMYLPSANTLGFATNGTLDMVINAAGNVAIGTSTPFNSVGYTVLDLYGSSVGGHFLVRSPNVTAEYLANDILGEAYIGTRTNHPIIFRTNTTTRLTIASTGAATFSSSVTANSTINGYLSTITGGQNPATSGTTPTNPMLNLTNNRGVGLYVGGQHASPFGIWMQVADTSNLGAYYPLLLQPNGGNVGISQNTPTALLHLGVANAAVDGTKGVKITNPAGTTVILECGVSSDSFVGTTSASDFSIRTGNAERIRISNGGLVTVTGTGSGQTSEGIFFKRTSSLAQGGYINGNGGVLNIVATNEQSGVNGITIFSRYNGTTISESMRITDGGNLLIGQTSAPTASAGTIMMLSNTIFFNYTSGVSSPYNQALRVDIVWDNWGGNNVVALLDVDFLAREFANLGGVSFGRIYALSSGGATNFNNALNTANVTTANATLAVSSPANFMLRLLFTPTNVKDYIGCFIRIPINSAGTGSSVVSITASLV
jgi:hypothetical protein